MVSHVDLQEIGAQLIIYGEINDSAMRHFNPALAFDSNNLKIVIRSCNFAVHREGEWYFRDGNVYSKTDVLYGDIDPKTLEVSQLKKLRISDNSPTRIKVSGLEDVRLFNRKDGMHAIGFESDRLTRSLHNESATLAEYIIKDDELIYLRTLGKPDKNRVEKNWQPTDKQSKLFEFTYSPTQTWKSGKVSGDKYTGNIHGGSQLLSQDNGTYLSLVHEKKIDRRFSNPYQKINHHIYDKYVYYTYIAEHDKNGIITKLSKPFRFGTYENIEFASSMVEYDGKMLIALGIRDCKYAICRIEKQKLLDLFER